MRRKLTNGFRPFLEQLEDRLVPATGPLSLVPVFAVTDMAIRSGPWSDPATWESDQVPAAGANVDIPAGTDVTLDGMVLPALHTVRVDGALRFDPGVNTSLLVDTLVVAPGGELDIGTTAAPIAAGVQARLTFADAGPIDTSWDPLSLSRGLISLGTVNMCGQPVTPFEAVANARAGDTVLELAAAPINWQVGDQLVFPGTNPDANQDENLTIAAISGTQVTLTAPLAHNHVAPEAGLTIYVADVTRNLMLASANSADIAGHGHTMFLNDQANIEYAGFCDLGRTDKRLAVNDPQLDVHGNLVPGTGTNPRNRDAMDFCDGGTDARHPPAVVMGCALDHSPGWGYVNDNSNVDFENDISVDVVGAGFVTATGSEIGCFMGDLAIREIGSGRSLISGQALQDFGHQGNGFWFQGPGVVVADNVATGAADAAYAYYNLGLTLNGQTAVFSTANLADPTLADGQPTIPVDQVPIAMFCGDLAYGSHAGVLVENNLKFPFVGQRGVSVVDDFTGWNLGGFGIYSNYSNETQVQNCWVIGNLANPSASDSGIETATEPQYCENFANNRVEGWNYGYNLWPWGMQTVTGGFVNAVHNILLGLDYTRPQGQTVTITGVTFGTLTSAQLGGQSQVTILMNGDFSQITSAELPALFAPNQIMVNAGAYQGQLYFADQAADFVPFPAGQSPDWVPAGLVGLSNQQLWSRYGLAVGGAVAPASATSPAGLTGLLGSPTAFPPAYTLVSDQTTRQIHHYKLVYLDPSGNRVVYPQPITLALGWNLVTIPLGGNLVTFFVFGTS